MRNRSAMLTGLASDLAFIFLITLPDRYQGIANTIVQLFPSSPSVVITPLRPDSAEVVLAA
jgi:hypothetical protein